MWSSPTHCPMSPRKQLRRNHLRLVPPAEPTGLAPILTERAAQREFVRLTQRLVDISIEITDLVDGDPDLEPSGDDFEDSDGI